jgi:hypothetical protein
MKILPALLLLALAASARAQTPDGVIKATVTVLADGVQRNVIINPETHLQEETLTDKKGKIMSKTTYELDERNLPTTATFFDAKGTQLYKANYKRDAADRITEETYTSTTGKSLGRRVYGYGPTGQADRFKVTRVDVYDADGNLVVPKKPASPGRPDKKKR